MASILDLTGCRFGRLSVLCRADKKDSSNGAIWHCKCDCGNETDVPSGRLKSGRTKSCGCLKRDVAKNLNGIPHQRLSSIHWAMKERCYKQYSLSYHNYGGRGIRVCDEWLDLKNGHDNFVRWALANGYSDDLTLDRIDVNGDYSPSNCRWVTRSVQARNTRNTRYVIYKGVRMCIADAAELSGINVSTIRSRINCGWSGERLFDAVRTVSMRG